MGLSFSYHTVLHLYDQNPIVPHSYSLNYGTVGLSYSYHTLLHPYNQNSVVPQSYSLKHGTMDCLIVITVSKIK